MDHHSPDEKPYWPKFTQLLRGRAGICLKLGLFDFKAWALSTELHCLPEQTFNFLWAKEIHKVLRWWHYPSTLTWFFYLIEVQLVYNVESTVGYNVLLYSKVIQLYIYVHSFSDSSPLQLIVVQSLTCLTLCDPTDCSTPGFPVLNYCPDSVQTHVHWVSDAIQPSHPLWYPLLLLPSTFPSIRVFSSKLALHIKGPKYWSFNFSISPSSEYSRFISFRIDWFDLLAVHRTFESLFQHHNYTVYYKILNIVPHAIPWRRKWQPSSVFLPGKSHRQGSLVGCSPWTHKESDMTEYVCTSVLYSRILLFIYFIFSSVHMLMSSS